MATGLMAGQPLSNGDAFYTVPLSKPKA